MIVKTIINQKWEEVNMNDVTSSITTLTMISIQTTFSSMRLVSLTRIAVPSVFVKWLTHADTSASASLTTCYPGWTISMSSCTGARVMRRNTTPLEATSRSATGAWRTKIVNPRSARRLVLANMTKSAKRKATSNSWFLRKRSDLTTEETRNHLLNKKIMKRAIHTMQIWKMTWITILCLGNEIWCMEAHGTTTSWCKTD